MNRINILLVIIAALFASCSKSSLEEIAKERSKLYIRPYDKYVKVRFVSDSICVINRSPFFVDDTVKASQYYLMFTIIGKPKLVECFYEISGKEHEYLEVYTKDVLDSLPVDKDERSRYLRMGASLRDCYDWKKVED